MPPSPRIDESPPRDAAKQLQQPAIARAVDAGRAGRSTSSTPRACRGVAARGARLRAWCPGRRRPGRSGASSSAGGCSMSPWTPTVLQWTTRRTPPSAAASTSRSDGRRRSPRGSASGRPGLTIQRGDVVDDLDARAAPARGSRRSARSPRTSSMPGARPDRSARRRRRARARARCTPRRARRRARCPPVNPVAPVTRTRTARPAPSRATRPAAASPTRASAPSMRSVARRGIQAACEARSAARTADACARTRNPWTRSSRSIAASPEDAIRLRRSCPRARREPARQRPASPPRSRAPDSRGRREWRATRHSSPMHWRQSGVCISTRRLTATSNARSASAQVVRVADLERARRPALCGARPRATRSISREASRPSRAAPRAARASAARAGAGADVERRDARSSASANSVSTRSCVSASSAPIGPPKRSAVERSRHRRIGVDAVAVVLRRLQAGGGAAAAHATLPRRARRRLARRAAHDLARPLQVGLVAVLRGREPGRARRRSRAASAGSRERAQDALGERRPASAPSGSPRRRRAPACASAAASRRSRGRSGGTDRSSAACWCPRLRGDTSTSAASRKSGISVDGPLAGEDRRRRRCRRARACARAASTCSGRPPASRNRTSGRTAQNLATAANSRSSP